MSAADLEARKTAAAAVLADYRAAVRSAPLSRPPGREWMLRLADALGSLLDSTGISLDPGQAATVLAALEDASEAIRERAAYCPACAAHPADLCDETADQLRRAEAYDHLAGRLREASR